MNFLIAVEEVSGTGGWDWDKCGGGENELAEAKPVCTAYLYCELSKHVNDTYTTWRHFLNRWIAAVCKEAYTPLLRKKL